MTNQHVIRNAATIRVKIINSSQSYKVSEVVIEDEENDLALLRVAANAAPLPLGDSRQASVGDDIFVIGNPKGLEGTLSTGIISAVRGQHLIQISAPISTGSSGAPVLNKRGKVIGIAVGAKEGGQNLNFAIPVSILTDLLSRARITVAGLSSSGTGKAPSGSRVSRSAPTEQQPAPPQPELKEPPTMEEAVDFFADKHQVPRKLARALFMELSGLDPNVPDTKRGAITLARILPSTARKLGYDPAELRRNPYLAMDAGLKYLRQNYDRFRSRAQNDNHAWGVAIAAYHAGPKRVEDDFNAGGIGVPDVDDGLINTMTYTGQVFDRWQALEKADHKATTSTQQNNGQNTQQPVSAGVTASDGASAESRSIPADFQAADKDVGVDIAIVTAVRVNLREEPDPNSSVVVEIAQKSILALLSREPKNNWLNVVDIDSGKEGWISRRLVRVLLSRNRKSQDVFKEEKYNAKGDPQISVWNNTDKFLTLKVGSKSYQISPNSEIQFTVPAGSYKYYASVAGVVPILGSKHIQEGYRYSWRFYIRKRM